MADNIQFYRGLEAKLPTLRPGQPGYCKDTKRLYIGSDNDNVLVADNVRIVKVDTLELEIDNVETRVDSLEAAQQQLKTAQQQLQSAVQQLQNSMNGKLTASAVTAQDALTDGATLEDVTAKVNALIAAMKASGVMSS